MHAKLFTSLTTVGRCRPRTGRASAQQPTFVSLFNGKDLTGWKIPAGDNGHWKVVNGVIDYDAASEANGDKSLWSEKSYGDFILRVDWRIKETPYINPNVPHHQPRRHPQEGCQPDTTSGFRCPTPTRASTFAATASPR